LRAEIFAWIFDTHSASATPVPGASQSVVMQGEQRELLVQRSCGSCRARIPFWNMRLECRCAGTRLLGLRFTDRNSARLMHRAMPLPMSLLYATVTNRNLREDSDPGFAGHAGLSNASTPSIPSLSIRWTACRCARTYHFTLSGTCVGQET
jgi:hypothetical protein